MLKSKKFKVFALILSFALFAASLVTNSLSKYVTMLNAPFEGKDHLDYTVNAVFIVKNQEELFAAINQGYTYLQLDGNIKNPLIITQKTENLDADLILDLNGVEIQRNGYEPILNIKKGVRLTIVDTSGSQTGGLYNPVGSVFNVTGGTITIMAGSFESGPRYSEYYSYNNEILNDTNGSTTRRTKVEAKPQKVLLRVKNQETNKFDEAEPIYAPIIKSYPEKKGNEDYKHGNLYFDNELDLDGTDFTINADTYCYYRTSEDISAEANEVAQADWFYSYYVDPNGFEYISAEVAPENEDDFVKVTIYGYEKVIENASLKEKPEDYLAVVKMDDGVLDVQNGGFYSYFGVDTTACVNAQGGSIKIVNGKFSSRVPNATTNVNNVQDSVNVKEDDDVAFGVDYFNNYKWSTQDENAEFKGNLARKGESFCILNGGDAVVNITSGKFYASNNSMISMGGGELSVKGGNFTKRLTNGIVTNDITELSAIYMESGALSIEKATCNVIADNVHPTNGIYMLAGDLIVSQTDYNISGNGSAGIRMLDGKLDVIGGACSIAGDDTYGIYSTVSGQDQFHVQNTSFALTDGDRQTGIYTENGRVNVSAETTSLISISGENGKGIHVATGGSVVSENYSYTLSGNDSHGIYSTAGTIDVSGGNLTLDGARSYGIYSTAGSITMDGGNISLSGSTSYGIYATSGIIGVSNGNITLAGANSYGIYSSAEAISLQYGDIELSGNTSYGIYATAGTIDIRNGDINLTGSTSYGVYSTADFINVQNGSISLEGVKSYGIYSGEGSVHMSGGNVTLSSNDSSYGVYVSSNHTVDVNLVDVTVDVGYSITDNKANNSTNRASVGVFLASNNANNKMTLTNTNVRSYEVGILVDGGSLEVYGSGQTNEISTRKASSIIVKGGGITFDESCNYNITSSTTRNNSETNAFNITLPTINANVNETYSNYDGIYVSGGDFISNGNVNITHAGLYNDIASWTYYDDIVIKSFAVRVEGGEVHLTKASITNSVGGGVMCNGGDVTLGTENSQKSDITIKTTGQTRDQSWRYVVDSAGGEWTVSKTKTGGHAMEIKGGNLTAYHGTYTAAYGDGIKLFAGKYTKEDENNGKARTTVNIHNGEFIGNMTGEGTQQISGPAACYGVKVFGSAVINIYDGKFDGRGGGACVSGVTDYSGSNRIDYSADYPANVYIYRGEFGSAKATDGFMIYEYANIIFGAGQAGYFGDQDSAEYRKNAIKIYSEYAPFSVNWIPYNNSPAPKSAYAVAYYGTYTGNYHGWNKGGNASAIQIYNQSFGYTYRTGNTYAEAVNIHNTQNVVFYPTTT